MFRVIGNKLQNYFGKGEIMSKDTEIVKWKGPGKSTRALVKMFRDKQTVKEKYPPRDTEIDTTSTFKVAEMPNPSDFNLIMTGQNAPKIDKGEVVRYLRACRIVYDRKRPYIYDGCTYVKCSDDEIARMIYMAFEGLQPKMFIGKSTIADIIANLSAVSGRMDIQPPDGWDADGEYDTTLIPFDNGLYSVELDKMLPFSPYIFITHRMDAMYRPKIQEHSVEKIYKKIIPNDKTRQFYFEMVGYMLFSPTLKPPAIFLTYGPGQTGKSALQEAVTRAAGRSNVSTLDLSQISGTFTTAEMQDKLINVCGETGSGMNREISKTDGELLKRLSDGQTITVQRKNKDPYEIVNTAKLWFVSNTLPDFGDTSSGLLRRLYIIPCRVPQNWEDQIYDKMQEPDAISWLVNKAMEGYIRFLNRGSKFAISDEMRRENKSYKALDNIMDYFDQRYNSTEPLVLADKLEGEYLTSVYDDYRSYTADGGGKAFSKRKFLERIRNEISVDIEWIRATKEDGKPTNLRVFKKI